MTNQIATLPDISRVEFNGQPVLTTAQLAQFYQCSVENLRDNFRKNRDRYIEGKHFFKLTGDALKDFLDNAENFRVPPAYHIQSLYLWTKRGALRHCKSVGTDIAWDVFEMLEETYLTQRVVDTRPGAPFDFERGIALSKLVPHCKDSDMKHRLIAKAANLILGEEFIPVPRAKEDVGQLTLFCTEGGD